MNIVNTTPHEINIYFEEQTEWNEERKFYQVKEGEQPVKSIPSSGTTFRMDMQEATITSLVLEGEDILISPLGGTPPKHHPSLRHTFNFGMPVMRVWYDGHDEFPNEVEGTYYIVSRLVAENAKDRDDFLMVHRTVRDSDGRIIGCTAFATASETFGIGEEE
tara:strand:- start:83 stop:568 length:486 start_codon:yes stop_codon:yes gene_type:complete